MTCNLPRMNRQDKWTAPTLDALYQAIDVTWAPAAVRPQGGWCFRDGAGGGQRVSATTRLDAAADIDVAEADAQAQGQDRLFMIREGDDDLDSALEARGYKIVDPVTVYAAPVADLASPPLKKLSYIPCAWPVARQREIWADGGIDAARLAVMDRVTVPKSYLLIRVNDRPAGVVFVACDGGIAMLHALEVPKEMRRAGVGTIATIGAAKWAATQGAHTLALLTVKDNVAANALYQSLNMRDLGSYHYRKMLR